MCREMESYCGISALIKVTTASPVARAQAKVEGCFFTKEMIITTTPLRRVQQKSNSSQISLTAKTSTVAKMAERTNPKINAGGLS